MVNERRPTNNKNASVRITPNFSGGYICKPSPSNMCLPAVRCRKTETCSTVFPRINRIWGLMISREPSPKHHSSIKKKKQAENHFFLFSVHVGFSEGTERGPLETKRHPRNRAATPATDQNADFRHGATHKTGGPKSGPVMAENAAQQAPADNCNELRVDYETRKKSRKFGTQHRRMHMPASQGDGPEWIRTIDLVIISDAL